MKTVIMCSMLVLVAASGCDAEEQRAQQKEAEPLTSAWNPCENQPDDSRPEGCNGLYECTMDRCQSGICTERATPRRSCGRANTGICDQSGQCITCESRCEQRYIDCQQRCRGAAAESCLCACERSYGVCVLPCGSVIAPVICPA